MNYRATISNEELQAMPAAQFGGRIVIVDTPETIEAACRDLESHGAIGFDTETRPSFVVGVTNKVALLQLSTPDTCYLFRLCRIALERPLQNLLSNKHVLKIGVAVSGDLRALNTLRRFRPAGFVDLQSEAPKYGIEEKSLRKLSAIVLGRRVSKAQRLSNWEAASLTDAQLLYAATDAWVSLRIYEQLHTGK